MQSILVFRFRERDLRTDLNRQSVEQVQITVAETLVLKSAGATTRKPASCATCFRTICCNC